MDLIEAFRGARRSIRNCRERPVEEEKSFGRS